MMRKKKTARGFAIYEFVDRRGAVVSLQKSSLATEHAIWFGLNDPDPRILASQAGAHGVRTDQTTGWVAFPMPPEVFIATRAHLTQGMVKRILPYLVKFAKTGEI